MQIKIFSKGEPHEHHTSKLDAIDFVPAANWQFSVRSFAAQNNSQENSFLMNRFYIAGFQFYDGPRLVGKMRTGELLSLATEEDNTHDRFAVKIERNSVMIGYVPKTDNFHIS